MSSEIPVVFGLRPDAEVAALTISLPAWESLRRGADEVYVLGRFQRVVDLWLGGAVVAVVTPEVGSGPLHLVVTALPSPPLPERVALRLLPGMVQLGAWRIALPTPLPLWNPRPAWEQLRCSPTQSAILYEWLRLVVQQRQVSPLSGVLGNAAPAPIRALARALKAQDPTALASAVAALAGWGPGLTPSGDDFLAGLMLALWWQEGEAAAPLCAHIVAAAAPHTTRLSGAFLRAAAAGWADERWHALLHALARESETAIARAVQAILAFGSSSGLDMLIGFWWGTLISDNR